MTANPFGTTPTEAWAAWRLDSELLCEALVLRHRQGCGGLMACIAGPDCDSDEWIAELTSRLADLRIVFSAWNRLPTYGV